MANWYYIGGTYTGRSGRWQPTLYEVNVGEGPQFSPDTFYIAGIEPGEAAGNDTSRIQKCTFDGSGNITYGTSYDIKGTGLFIEENIDYRYMSVGKNGNVMIPTHDDTAEELHIHVWDSDLSYIDTVTMSSISNSASRKPQYGYFGEDSNIYAIQLASSNRVRVRKYDSDLNSIWDSSYFTVEDPGGSNDNAGAVGLVFFDSKVILHAGQHNNTSYTSLISLDMYSGDLIARSDGIQTTSDLRCSNPILKRFDGDKFLVGYYNTFFEAELLRVYNEDLTLNRTVDLSTIGLLMLFSSSTSSEKNYPYEVIPDSRYFVIGNKFTDKIKCIDPMTDELIWETSATNTWFRMNQVDERKLLMGVEQAGNDVHGLILIDYDGNVEFNVGTAASPVWDDTEIDDEDIACAAMSYEGWELDYNWDESGIIYEVR